MAARQTVWSLAGESRSALLCKRAEPLQPILCGEHLREAASANQEPGDKSAEPLQPVLYVRAPARAQSNGVHVLGGRDGRACAARTCDACVLDSCQKYIEKLEALLSLNCCHHKFVKQKGKQLVVTETPPFNDNINISVWGYIQGWRELSPVHSTLAQAATPWRGRHLPPHLRQPLPSAVR